jgi:glycosyltransferase involved in cell wall biosynthesis
MELEVSVIIPVFNRREMVADAIHSVLRQCAVRFELIVVDDGSTDGTADAVEKGLENASAPARVIQTKNRGVAAARNTGAEAARAPLLAFLDSDDIWMEQKLARQLRHLRDHTDLEIAQCDEIWIRDGVRVNPGLRHRKCAGDIFVDSLRTCLISPSAVIMAADLFERIRGFDETMIAAEDYDLWLRILIKHEVGLLDENLVTRRAGHPGQLSATVPAIDRYRILAVAKLLANPELHGARRTATAEVLAEKCSIYSKGLERRGRETARFYADVADRASGNWVDGGDEGLTTAINKIRSLLEHKVDGQTLCS